MLKAKKKCVGDESSSITTVGGAYDRYISLLNFLTEMTCYLNFIHHYIHYKLYYYTFSNMYTFHTYKDYNFTDFV